MVKIHPEVSAWDLLNGLVGTIKGKIHPEVSAWVGICYVLKGKGLVGD